MSVNIDLHFTVSELADAAQAEAVHASVGDLLRDEGLEDEIVYGPVVDNGVHYVVGEARSLISISGFGRWQPYFETSFAAAVAQVAPDAETSITWGYPDEDY